MGHAPPLRGCVGVCDGAGTLGGGLQSKNNSMLPNSGSGPEKTCLRNEFRLLSMGRASNSANVLPGRPISGHRKAWPFVQSMRPTAAIIARGLPKPVQIPPPPLPAGYSKEVSLALLTSRRTLKETSNAGQTFRNTPSNGASLHRDAPWTALLFKIVWYLCKVKAFLAPSRTRAHQ